MKRDNKVLSAVSIRVSLLLAAALGFAAPAMAQENQEAGQTSNGSFGDPSLSNFSLGNEPRAPQPTTPTIVNPDGTRVQARPQAQAAREGQAVPRDVAPQTAPAQRPVTVPGPVPQAIPTLPDVIVPDAITPIAPESQAERNRLLGNIPWTTLLIGLGFLMLIAAALWSEIRKKGRRDLVSSAVREARDAPPVPRKAVSRSDDEVAPKPNEAVKSDDPLAGFLNVSPKPAVPAARSSTAAPDSAAANAHADAAPQSGGLVSTNLTAKVRASIKPLEGRFDEDGNLRLVYDIVVSNYGGASARNVEVEALLVQAGPDRDREIAQFFREPIMQGAKFGAIGAMSAMAVQVANRIVAKDLKPLDHEGRQLVVPFIALKLRYGPSTSVKEEHASFLVGIPGGTSGKLGPLRVDGGARHWTSLEIRQHSEGAAETA